jgi:Ca-activated chloride channel family protein
LAVHLESGEILTRHDLVHEVALDDSTSWSWEGSFRLPSETDGAVVLVEILDTGDWGESFASFVVRSASELEDRVADSSSVPIVPPRPVVRLVMPPGDVHLGKVPIQTRTEALVKRVTFYLDGKRVSTRRRSPFSATIDVGSTPRQRLLVVVAYGDRGEELGRDAVLLNEAGRSFTVRIVEPSSSRRIGPVEVEAALKLPTEGRLDRLEFFWRDELVGTVSAPPFRQRIFIPVASEPGFIRVVAHLADGRLAEDVVLMNADEFEDELTVRLVELYVVVTDREGKPVGGLEEKDFKVLEEGQEQTIEKFSIAGSLPITVGLTIDSSLSLFMKMPDVQEAAMTFVDGLTRGQDRAFLVGFGSSPRLVRATTGNLSSVMSGIDSLRPGGTTALWEAIVLSLSQLRESAGRKALVVFYDGDDEDEGYSFGSSFKLAQETGVPIYLIVMNNAAARSNGASFGTKSRAGRLDRLARAGGGRVFFVRTDENLEAIFQAIRDELRSHYLLTYYPTRELADAERNWRPIEVQMQRRGLQARTLSGYGGLLQAPEQ